VSEPPSSYARSRDHLENAPAVRAARRWGPEDAIPTEYRGITFRSALESAWARTLDHYGIAWEFEPETVRLASGKHYTPDFRLPGLRTFIEVKGPHMLRANKTAEFARGEGPQVIVLLGFSSLQRTVTDCLWQGYIQWLDPLGYDMRFTQCGSCPAWQWLRPQLSRSCRQCGETCTGLLARPGEMQFTEAADEPYKPPTWTPF
jgi:hypothetical protein